MNQRFAGNPARTPIAAWVVLAALLLTGCATPPPTTPTKFLPENADQDTAGLAYFWSSGVSLQPALSFIDYASVTRVDGVEIPSAYTPSPGSQPFLAWLLEVPAGRHSIEILDKETIPLCGYLGCLVVEKGRRTLELDAEAGRIYTPLIDERCGQKWFWIEDSGAYDAAMLARRFVTSQEPGPVVAGKAVPEGECSVESQSD